MPIMSFYADILNKRSSALGLVPRDGADPQSEGTYFHNNVTTFQRRDPQPHKLH